MRQGLTPLYLFGMEKGIEKKKKTKGGAPVSCAI